MTELLNVELWVWFLAAHLAGVLVQLTNLRHTWHVACETCIAKAEETRGEYLNLPDGLLPWRIRLVLGVLIAFGLFAWPLWIWMPMVHWWVARTSKLLWTDEFMDDLGEQYLERIERDMPEEIKVEEPGKFVHPSAEVRAVRKKIPTDEAGERVYWQPMTVRVSGAQRADGKGLAIIIVPTGRRVYSATALEVDASAKDDTRAILSAHSHSMIIEDASRQETHAACMEFRNQWKAGRQLEECRCVEIELNPLH